MTEIKDKRNLCLHEKNRWQMEKQKEEDQRYQDMIAKRAEEKKNLIRRAFEKAQKLSRRIQEKARAVEKRTGKSSRYRFD